MSNGKPVAIHAEHDHVQLGFYVGSSLKDPKGMLEGKDKFVRFVRIQTVKDIDDASIMKLLSRVM